MSSFKQREGKLIWWEITGVMQKTKTINGQVKSNV